jgi:hypothetical protein
VVVEFATVAVNCCVPPVTTEAVPGVTVTVMAGGVFDVVLLLLEPQPANTASRKRHVSASSLRNGIFNLLRFLGFPGCHTE